MTSVNKVKITGEKILFDEKVGDSKTFKDKLKIANLPIVDSLVEKLKNIV